MRRRLTQKQKAHNRAEYNRIRRAWEKTDKSVDYKHFKRIVIGLSKGRGESIKETAEKYAHSRRYKSAEDIGKENVLSGLKSDFSATYQELRRKAGRFNKGEKLTDKLYWDETKQSYVLKGSKYNYMIDISNSPKSATLIQL